MLLDESARLRALNDLGLLNSAPSESFDRITRMASQIFDVPIAAVSLTDRDRQWFKSRVGCGTEIPRDKAPCAEVTRMGDVLVVSDLSNDIRFQGAKLDQDGVRFYAGAPLTTRDGFTLGAMCVLDTKPRTITPEQAKVLTDLAAMVMSQIELQHSLGRIDPASGLPNRNQFAEDFEDVTRDHAGEERVAMLVDFIDPAQLNKALRIFGPSHLDIMAKDAADTTRTYLAPGTTLYHVGVTQFVALLRDRQAEALKKEINAHFNDLASNVATPTRSRPLPTMGLMQFRLGELSAAQVLRSVHGAAQDARSAGQVAGLHSICADVAHERQYAILSGLAEAVAAPDQLSLHYQPRVDLQSGRCESAEALLRWNHPILGNVPPGEFFPLAEATELARPLTQWVLEAALAQIAAWQSAGLTIKVSVNVATANLEEGDFADRLGGALVRHAVSPQFLEIEFTESGLIRNQPRILANLAAIRALGVGCAIDDFGTGYSSFSYLKDIPAETIKIDQSFILNLTSAGADGALVRGMITMGHDLGRWVVAEGVETEEAYAFLRQAGCDEAQGYLLSRPVTADAFALWVLAHNQNLSRNAAA